MVARPLNVSGVPVAATVGMATGNVVVATFTDSAGADVLADYGASIAWGDGQIVMNGGSQLEAGVTGAVLTNVDDTIEPDLPDNIRVLVEKSRQDAQARAKHLSKYPSSKGFPLIGDDDVAPLTHQPTQRKSPRRASQRNRRG